MRSTRLIATYPKPYVALIDGICMGGGIGLSVHAPYRVASEHAGFAMPETAIGFFPDIGATFVLPRLPGELGTYLGLTGLRVNGADAVHAGFATHYTPRVRMAELSAALARDGVTALAEYDETLPPFSLGADRPAVDHCFSADTILDIVRRLQAVDAAWAVAALKAMRTVSPVGVALDSASVTAGPRPDLAAGFGCGVRADPHDDGASGFR